MLRLDEIIVTWQDGNTQVQFPLENKTVVITNHAIERFQERRPPKVDGQFPHLNLDDTEEAIFAMCYFIASECKISKYPNKDRTVHCFKKNDLVFAMDESTFHTDELVVVTFYVKWERYAK